MEKTIKNVVVLIPRGEALRNFYHSGIIYTIAKTYKIDLYTVVDIKNNSENIEVKKFPSEQQVKLRNITRLFLDLAHEYQTNSVRHGYGRKIRFYREKGFGLLTEYIKHLISWCFSSKPILNLLNRIEIKIHLTSKTTNFWKSEFIKNKPLWVLNTSHIHGIQSELPCKIAQSLGIPVYGFVFSWDNLTTRSRIVIKYDKLFLWHLRMIDLLIKQYGKSDKLVKSSIVTGTPQFDYHNPKNPKINREELFEYLKIGKSRITNKIVMYSTAMASDFPQEHLILIDLIEWFESVKNTQNNILVIRPYIKGLNQETVDLMGEKYENVYFMPVLWNKEEYTPRVEDALYYRSILAECSVGINIASTVTLELLLYGKNVINIGFDHPQTTYNSVYKYSQHLEYDHFQEVVKSESTYIAENMDHLIEGVENLLLKEEQNIKGIEFINWFFDGKLEFNAGEKILKNVLY